MKRWEVAKSLLKTGEIPLECALQAAKRDFRLLVVIVASVYLALLAVVVTQIVVGCNIFNIHRFFAVLLLFSTPLEVYLGIRLLVRIGEKASERGADALKLKVAIQRRDIL